MNYGFTGPREGMTDNQQLALAYLLRSGDTLRHGRCIGADAQADATGRACGCHTIAHPGPVPSLTAPTRSTEVRAPKPFHERNRDIVDESACLIAAPQTLQEEMQGSGTWQTIRYARKRGVPVIILDP